MVKVDQTNVSEDEVHTAVAAYLARAITPPWRFSTFPAGGGGAVRGALLKKRGLARGWPDIMLLHPSGVWHGIELKSPIGRLRIRPEQAAFIEWADGRVAVCRSVDQVEATLRAWGIPLRATTMGRIAA